MIKFVEVWQEIPTCLPMFVTLSVRSIKFEELLLGFLPSLQLRLTAPPRRGAARSGPRAAARQGRPAPRAAPPSPGRAADQYRGAIGRSNYFERGMLGSEESSASFFWALNEGFEKICFKITTLWKNLEEIHWSMEEIGNTL